MVSGVPISCPSFKPGLGRLSTIWDASTEVVDPSPRRGRRRDAGLPAAASGTAEACANSRSDGAAAAMLRAPICSLPPGTSFGRASVRDLPGRGSLTLFHVDAPLPSTRATRLWSIRSADRRSRIDTEPSCSVTASAAALYALRAPPCPFWPRRNNSLCRRAARQPRLPSCHRVALTTWTPSFREP